MINICIKMMISMLESLFGICEKKYPLLKNSLNNELNIHDYHMLILISQKILQILLIILKFQLK